MAKFSMRGVKKMCRENKSEARSSAKPLSLKKNTKVIDCSRNNAGRK